MAAFVGELDYPDGEEWENCIGPCWVYSWEYSAFQHNDYGEYELEIIAGNEYYYTFFEAARYLWQDCNHTYRELLHRGRSFYIEAVIAWRWCES